MPRSRACVASASISAKSLVLISIQVLPGRSRGSARAEHESAGRGRGQAGDERVATFGERGDGVRPDGTRREDRARRLFVQIVHGDLEAATCQVGGEVPAQGA